MKKTLFTLLALVCSTSFAGSYSDEGIVADSAQDQQSKYKHFYVNAGVNYYGLNTPNFNMPFSSTNTAGDQPLTSSQNDLGSEQEWSMQPNLAFGYQFLNSKANWFTNIFGMENSIEIRASYLNSSTTQDVSYDNAGAFQWYINGDEGPTNLSGDGYVLQNSSTDYDSTYQNYGIYYIGNKLIANRYINAPYFGVDFIDLTQNTSYDLTMETEGNGSTLYSNGTGDLDSYYFGIELGDKFTVPFKNHYGVYGSLGMAIYGEHTDMTATQRAAYNDNVENPQNTDTITVTESDDVVTFNAKAEIGFSYFFNNNFDNLSPSITLLTGIEYWNDVAYVKNPTSNDTATTIDYDGSTNPYVGLQVHIPLS